MKNIIISIILLFTLSCQIIAQAQNFSTQHNSIEISSFQSEIEITEFLIFDSTLKKDFTQNDTILLNYDDNFFTIYFESSDSVLPKNIQYQYKLEGVDENWRTIRGENKVQYTKIDPGSYLFRVKGIMINSKISADEGHLYIVLSSPFYAKWWFFSSIGFVLLAIVIVFLYLWVRKIRIHEKNMELEQRLLRSQINPHFIFNSLTSIQYFVLKSDVPKAVKYLAGFAKLLRFILQNSRHEFVVLDKELDSLKYYLELQQLRFEKRFVYSIKVDEKIANDMVLIPPMILQPLVENSLQHGIKNISWQGEIEINFEQKNEMLIIEIIDNGIGIDKSLNEKLVAGIEHKSLSANITTERLKYLSRNKHAPYKICIIDRSRQNPDNQGTYVRVSIPLKYKM